MADDLASFARDCRTLAKAMRALPREVKSELTREVKGQVTEPLAKKVAEASRGKWAVPLSQAVKVRGSAVEPTIAVGGTRSLVRNGATGRQLIFGTEFGGGKRVSTVNRQPGRKGRISKAERSSGVYRRKSTMQFVPATPFVFDTVEQNVPWVLETYGDIAMKKINEAMS